MPMFVLFVIPAMILFVVLLILAPAVLPVLLLAALAWVVAHLLRRLGGHHSLGLH
jgi:hypothetical protein